MCRWKRTNKHHCIEHSEHSRCTATQNLYFLPENVCIPMNLSDPIANYKNRRLSFAAFVRHIFFIIDFCIRFFAAAVQFARCAVRTNNVNEFKTKKDAKMRTRTREIIVRRRAVTVRQKTKSIVSCNLQPPKMIRETKMRISCDANAAATTAG